VSLIERVYKIHHKLHENRSVGFEALRRDLGVSVSQLKRDLAYMRARLNAPIEWSRELNGYFFDPKPRAGPKYELPGLWFSPSEIHALLTVQHLLSSLQPSVLTQHIRPLQSRLRAALESHDNSPEEIGDRIRILRMGRKEVRPRFFEVIASALLNRKQLHIRHFNRNRNERTERDISPQRMVHYRDNWYIDAWCHLRNDLRSFALDVVEQASVLPKKAKNIPGETLDAYVKSGYGIFAGKDVQWAKLRFSPRAARWVANEEWHPNQRSRFDDEGYYVLELPYSQATELIMDVLRHGREVEVLEPIELRTKVRDSLLSAASLYQ